MKNKLPNYRDTYGGHMGDSTLTKRPEPNALDDYIKSLQDPKTPKFEEVERIRNTRAWVVRDTANHMICLQSYFTIVAVKLGASSKDLANFSATTAKQQRYFMDWCRENAQVV
jgi:hypothetical protein